MTDLYSIPLALLGAYLIGSFPTAYVMGRLTKGIDMREVGSRNVGAMNVFYQVGFAAGLTVLAVDIGKGAAAVALARFLGASELVQLIAGGASVLGHSFTPFLGFRGGKGGASCIGILVFLMPWGIPVYLTVFGLALLLTRFPTLSYSLAFLVFPLVAWLVYHSLSLIIYSIVIILLPGIKYVPRVVEMRRSGGSWRHVFLRKGLKDRL